MSKDKEAENIELNEWQLALEKKLQELKECQIKEGINSCMKCEKMIGCTLRDSYVKAVYSSMNKGSGGGFEF